MSIAIKQRNCEERTPRHQETRAESQQNTPYKDNKKPHEQKQPCNPIKSTVIDNPTQDKQQHVAHKKSKQLTKQTPVVSIEEERQYWVNTLEAEGGLNTKTSSEDYTEIYETPPDYQIYENGKVNEFFKDKTPNESNPKTISDVCLVNDHYILVKMPSIPEPIQTEVLKGHTNHMQAQRTNRKLCQYLRYKRSCIRKIAPITEEPEDFEHSEKEDNSGSKSKSSHCLNVNTCWQMNNHEEDVEIYQTRTKINKTRASVPSPAQSVISVEKSKPEMLYQSPYTRNESTDHKPQEVQSISGKIFTSSLQNKVTLSNRASLVESDKTNGDIDYCRNSCTSPRRRKCPHFESFHWLLRPFRGKYHKPKPKIQAVVYKTYFVKWTKPPEILHHGYGGVKSSRLIDIGTSVIRRCRSAIF